MEHAFTSFVHSDEAPARRQLASDLFIASHIVIAILDNVIANCRFFSYRAGQQYIPQKDIN